METRELRYFVAVAEELHFGRAAERLGIAQPPLSRAIRQLEVRLGGPLLVRTSRGVQLNEAGAVLLQQAGAALAGIEAAERRTRRALATDGGPPRLVLVAKAGASSELLAKLLDAHAAEPDAGPVDLLLCEVGEQGPCLRDGRADVALLHPPFDATAGMETAHLKVEQQVLLLPAGHPLSGRVDLTMADACALDDPPLVRHRQADGTFPDGPGPAIRDTGQLYQLVALGRASAVLPESAAAQAGETTVAVPLADAPSVTTVLAWPTQSRSPTLATLISVAERL